MQHDTATEPVATTPGVKPLRADAARNRDKLLAAATEVFGEDGTEASLEEIARRAGVGVGTLYRHFPTRAVLIEQVYRHSVDDLCADADRLIANETPLVALETWVQHFVGYVARKKGMASALKEALGPESAHVFADVHSRLLASAEALLTNAQRAGSIRADAQPMDLISTVSGVCMAAAVTQAPEGTRRVIRLVLDGLRYGAPQPA